MVSRALSLEDLKDLVYGATILSTGGGGSPSTAIKTAETIIKKGLEPKIIGPEEVKNEALVFSAGDMGGGVSKEEEARFEKVYKSKIPTKWDNWPLEKWSPSSASELAKFMGREPDVYLATELGPGAFMGEIYLGARDGKAVIDGDPRGRATPDAAMSMFYLKGVKIIAGASTSHFGDIVIWKNLVDRRRLEDLGRAFATASGGGVGLVTAYKWADAKRAVIPHTISKCINIGRRIRNSEDSETLKVIVRETKGVVLFKGRIIDVKNDSKHGHLYGEYSIEGSGKHSGHNFRIWIKNENHIGWKDGKPCVTSPDIITIYDPDAKLGVWNWDRVPQDRDIFVLGIPCDPSWRTKKGLEVFGPRAFGFDYVYSPVENMSAISRR